VKTTYRHSWLGFLVAILMMSIAYGQNETILIANFMNGNNSVLNSRVYLFNSSDIAGDITVRVFRLPLGSGVPQELTITPLSLGTLGPKSALNIKVAEDILTLLGIPLPYIDDGGNLTLEFTIGAEKVRGVAQVFTSDFAFGTYPLQGPESSGTGPGGEIPDGAVTTVKIADAAVTTAKIANEVVGSTQLADTVTFGASSSPGQINVVNSNDNTTLILGNLDNEGVINVNDAAGNLKVFLGVSNNGGSLSVVNSSDITTAGMNGSTGQVFGTSKAFIVADPSDSNRMIKYTSLEGPEAAIYVRGTANLVSGQGHIEFPDHFSVMAVPSSITVSLTPRSASSMGLAAVSVSSQGIDVAELGGGTNSYSFDYVAYAVRKGFEDYEVYLTQEQVRGLTGQAQALELRPRPLSTTPSPLKAFQQQE